jgi:ADP-heptose:LPS heptosyltransferase
VGRRPLESRTIHPAREFGLLEDLEGFSISPLQWGPPAEECLDPNIRLPLNAASVVREDILATAHAILQSDLVITVDSMIAHLAGTLRRPVWVLLRFDADWRWLLDRADSPWYPTMRLFRQHSPGDWSRPLRLVHQELATLLHEKAA